MKTELYNQSAEIIGEVELPDRIFGVALNHDLIQQVLQAQIANAREVIAHKALFMVLSSKINDKELMALEGWKFSAPKTKEATTAINALTSKMEGYKTTKKKRDRILFVFPKKDQSIERAMKNVPFVEFIEAKNLNIKDLLSYKYLVLSKESVPVIEQTFKI